MTTRELKYTVFQSRMGWVGIMASSRGLLGTTLSENSAEEAYQLLGDRANQAIYSPSSFNELTERLKDYFNGNKVVFKDRLDLLDATAFQCQVWEITRLIPYGETRSYRWVAERIKRPGAVRAVGQVLGRNPLLIIVPCHRVIASDGNLGGFRAGVEMKQRLLHLERLTGIK